MLPLTLIEHKGVFNQNPITEYILEKMSASRISGGSISRVQFLPGVAKDFTEIPT